MKRGFSRMLWGGGVILLVVLFFVSVYGVKEGFKCVTGQTYSKPTITTTKTPNDTLSGCVYPDCVVRNFILNNKNHAPPTEICYYGSPDTTGILTEKTGHVSYLDTTVTPTIYKWKA